MIQRNERDYEVSLWSLQDSLIAILKQYGHEGKGQIQDGKLTDKDDGTQSFSFTIPMYYYKDGQKIQNPSWYNVESGALLVNMRKIKVIFNKDNQNRKIYEFLIVKVNEEHDDENSLYCNVQCQGLAFHELGKIGYKISLSADDFYNDDYDWATNGSWYNVKTKAQDITQPLATLNYWNDKVFSTINNWTYEIQMNWDSHSLQKIQKEGVLEDYTSENDVTIYWNKRDSNKVYEEDFIDSWSLKEDQFVPSHITHAREKARVSIDLKDSNIYNITQSLAETFGVFCRYEYQHDEDAQIIGRKVIYYNNFLNEQEGIKDITYPYHTTSIKREIDSADLVTKLFVKSIENNNGVSSIIDVGANKSQEDYILNFDYIYRIGGITKQQYDEVENYLVKIRSLNDQLKPVSAKVISLQSKLVKLEAELTTCKNAIIQDTQQILSTSALRSTITSGDDTISISASNPQTAVLLQDATETRVKSYYVKITQKGVYGETIQLYRNYSYQDSRLSSQINTGVVQYDDAGEVIRVSNIFINENDSKTIYIIYNYKPSLYYDRVLAMWETRLNNDTLRKNLLEQEIAQLNYTLYGHNSKYSMKNINVANIIDIAIYDKYQNLIRAKQQAIKDFNALMGPALREGYWQPEDYSDYGDQYNDRFIIRLNDPKEITGSTGNTYFKWDNELFESQQNIYYEFSAAQDKQIYPCIDLSTANGKKILQLIADNPNDVISFVYRPITYDEQNVEPKVVPVIESQRYVTVLPGIYTWENNTSYNMKLSSSFLSSGAPQELIDYLENNTTYDGYLPYNCNQGWKYSYTTFLYDMKKPDTLSWQNNVDNQILTFTYENNQQGRKHKITYKNNIYPYFRSYITNDTQQQNINGFSARILSTLNNTLEGYKFRLSMENLNGENHAETEIRLLNPSTVTAIENTEQHALKTDSNSKFVASYQISNDYAEDMNINYYYWTVTQNENELYTISYLNTSYVAPNNQNFNNDELHYRLTITNNGKSQLHTLEIFNLKNIDTSNDNPIKVKLCVKTPQDYLKNLNGIIAAEYQFYGTNEEPWYDTQLTEEESHTSVEFNDNSQENKYQLIVYTHVVNKQYNQNLIAIWEIGNNQDGWNAITNDNNTYIITQPVNDTTKTDNCSKLIINIANRTSGQTFLNKYIRCKIKHNNSSAINDYYYFNSPLSFTSPIQLYDWIQYQPIIILEEESKNYQMYFSAQHATIFEWRMKKNNIEYSKTLNISRDAEDTYFSIIENNNTYQVKYTIQTNDAYGQTLETPLIFIYFKIFIPSLSDDNPMIDNGILIRCICSNESAHSEVSFPQTGENLQEQNIWHKINIAYPIVIQTEDQYQSTTSTQWWPIANQQNQIGTIYFTIPTSLSTTEENFTITGEIYGPFSEEEEIENTSNNALENFEITANIISLGIINQNKDQLYQAIINLQYNMDSQSSIINLTDNTGQNIINTNNTQNDRQYKLISNLTISYQSDTVNNVSINHLLDIIIRQNIPEFKDNKYKYDTTNPNKPAPALPISTQSNNGITELYDKTPYTINPAIFFKINSIQTLNWMDDYGSRTTNVHKWENFSSKDSYIVQKQSSQINIINKAKGTYEYLNIGLLDQASQPYSIGTTSIKYYDIGFSKHLYFQAQNPWGTVYSRIFIFEKQSTTGGE